MTVYSAIFKDDSLDKHPQLLQHLKEIGQLDHVEIVKELTPHWLRHTFASELMANGAAVKQIMEAGGWKTSKVVIETYSHNAPSEVAQQVQNLPFNFKEGENTK